MSELCDHGNDLKSCKHYHGSPEPDDHQHRFDVVIAVEYDGAAIGKELVATGYRATKLMCSVGDCDATKEVKHD